MGLFERSIYWTEMITFWKVFCIIFIGCVAGKAVQMDEGKGEAPGPKNAMDQFHGVLMHGDGELGDTHKGEDKLKVLQEKDELKNQGPAGPRDRMEELHDTLMHHDGKGVHDAQPAGPEKNKDTRVPDAMDHLHGVLMHGDKKKGKDHRDTDEQKNMDTQQKGDAKVGNLMDDVHGILMHGDRERGKDHKHADGKLAEEVQTPEGRTGVDPDQALHGGTEHKHNEDVKEVGEDFDPNRLWDKAKKEEKFMAFSFGQFISSDIIDNVDKLKRRYLSRFFGGGDKDKKSADSANMESKDGRQVSPRMKVGQNFGPVKDKKGSGSGAPPHDET